LSASCWIGPPSTPSPALSARLPLASRVRATR
jgi:hypothetical protein